MRISQKYWLLMLLAAGSAYGFLSYREQAEGLPEGNILRDEWMAARPKTSLRQGDLVFRYSRGTISSMLRLFSRRDPRYSHAGILSVEKNGYFVYHAIGGEGSPAPGIRRESLEQFCSPASVHSFGIYRLDLDAKQANDLVRRAQSLYEQRMPFDLRYDLESDSSVYCTEFVYKLLKQAGEGNYVNLTTVSGFTYVACDNLYIDTHAMPVYAYAYADR